LALEMRFHDCRRISVHSGSFATSSRRWMMAQIVMRYATATSFRGGRANAAATVPAIVEPIGTWRRKRAVATIATGHRLSADELAGTLRMLGRRLEVAFAKRGLALSDLELIEE
jgi:hypothetical protein